MEATELPAWRRRPSLGWTSPQAPTSQLLLELQAWYDQGARPLTESYLQAQFLEFVDVSGKLEEQMLTEPGVSNAQLLELNFCKLDVEERKACLGLMAGMDYVENCLKQQQQQVMLFGLEDVLEIHRLVMSGASAGLRDEEDALALLSVYLDELNCDLVSLQHLSSSLSKQALPLFKLGARTLMWFHSRRPFRDGNSRVAELLVCGLLNKLAPCFPLQVRLQGALDKGMISSLQVGATRKTLGVKSTSVRVFMLMQGETPPPSGVEDVTALIIERFWQSWEASNPS